MGVGECWQAGGQDGGISFFHSPEGPECGPRGKENGRAGGREGFHWTGGQANLSIVSLARPNTHSGRGLHLWGLVHHGSVLHGSVLHLLRLRGLVHHGLDEE